MWYAFSIHHVPRIEEWPVMSADLVSFWLKPSAFSDANPALDVVPSPTHSAAHCHPSDSHQETS